MPVSDVRIPDGRILKINHPEGASEREIFEFAEYNYLQSQSDQNQEPDEEVRITEPVSEEEEEEETGLFDDITEFGQRTVGSAARILGQAPAGLQSLFRDGFEEDEELVERNRAIEESVRTGLGYDEEYDDSTLGLAADVTGSVLGFGGAAVTGAAIGSVVPGVGTLLGGIIGAGTGILLGAGSNVASGMEETARQIESGRIVNDEDYEAASTRLAAIGASEGLPFIGPAFRVMRRITGAAAKNPKAVEKLGDYIRSAAIQGTEEAAQEALAGIASDAVLKEYINPDIEIGDSLAVDIVAGGTAGALFDVGINLATRRRRGISDTEEDPVEPLREERIAEETILRENIENAEAARRERASQLASVGPAPTQEPVVLPELLDINGIIVEPTREEVMAMEKDRAGEDLSREERALIRGYNQRVPTADSYKAMARTVVQQMGDSFPVEAEFYIEEDIDGQPGMVAIKDANGNTYGRPVPEGMRLKLQPAVAALNGQTVEENIFQSNRSVIADSKEDYSPEQVSTLQRVGRIALGPESLSYTSEAADYAGGTTVEKGFTPQLSAEKVIEANIPRKKQTISQRINVRRIKEGKVPSNRFAISEIRREIGKDVGRLAEYEAGAFRVDTYAALPNQVNGKFAVQPMSLNVDGRLEPSGDLIFDRPSTAAERQAAREAGKPARKRVQFASAAEAFEFARDANSRKGGSYIPSKELMGDPEFGIDKIQEILDRKNISSPLNSPEIKNLAARFTGRKLRRDQSISDLTASERQLFYQKLRQLPRFSSPTNIPLFKLRPKKEPAPVVEEQVEGEALALPSPTTPEGMDAATKGMLQRAMEKRLKQLGLTEVTPVVTNLVNSVVKDTDGNVYFRSLPEEIGDPRLIAGGYSRDGARVLQVAVDAIMAQSPKTDNIEAAVIDILNHEVVHALRELDVITQSELQLLERLSTRYKKVDTDQTYLEWATETYTDPNNPEQSLSPVDVAEEAIAEMIRDAVTGRIIIDNKPAKLAGKPRSIINKIVKFFKGLVSTATEVDPDYTSFTQFMNDLEAGRIGERERGVVRTLYRLEKATGDFVDRKGVRSAGQATYSATVDTPTGRTVIETDDPEFTERSARTLAEQGARRAKQTLDQYPKAAQLSLAELESYNPGIFDGEGDYKSDLGIPSEDIYFEVLGAKRQLEQGEARRSPVKVDTLMQDAGIDSLMFSLVDRRNLNFKDVTTRIPELTEAAQRISATLEEIKGLPLEERQQRMLELKREYNDLIDEYKPVLPFEFVPAPEKVEATGGWTDAIGNGRDADDQVILTPTKRPGIRNALREDKKERVNLPIEEGTVVELRLDIPAYKEYGTWVPTLHIRTAKLSKKDKVRHKKHLISEKTGRDKAELTSYRPFASVENVTFPTFEASALKVADASKPKSTFAKVSGNLIERSEAETLALAEEAVASSLRKDGEWTQVGMDPERHGYFYDRSNHRMMLTKADEVIQVGPLVLAKNAEMVDAQQVLSDEVAGAVGAKKDNVIAFARKAADRNVVSSSQKQLDGVIEYAVDNQPDDIGMATLRAGPMANSINSGFADQSGAYPSFTTPPPKSFLKRIVFEVQDKLTDLKAIEDSINEAREAAGLPRLRSSESAYIGEETLAGKIGAFDRSFTENELKPLLKEMTDNDVTLDQMDEFLVLRHAVERNARVRKINPSMPDAGSGKWNGVELTDAYVKRKMLADYGMTWNDAKGEWVGGNDISKVMSALAGKIDKMNSTTLAISQKGGLITEQERAFLDGYFKYYTPLRGISQEEDIAAESDARTAGSGGSLSVVGKEVKRTMGRETEAISPFATIVSERGTQAARAVKNTSFGKRLIDLIQQNPNDEVWELISPDNPRYKRAFDTSYTYVGPDASRYGERKTDISGEADKKNWVKKVRVIQDPVINPTGQELLGVKVDGEQYFVEFKNPDLRKAVLNLDAQSVGFLVEKLNGITRFMSYVNTSLNPEFVMGNFPRDVQTAIYNIIGEQSMAGGKAVNAKGIVGKVIKRTIPSIGVFYKGFRNPDSLSAEDARDFNEFIKTGAKTDWFHSKDPEQQKKNIESMIEMASGTFKGNAKKGFRSTLDFIDDYNSAVENGVRLATFVAARDAMIEKGIPRNEAIQEAATLAKNLTVNFNRKGNSGQLLNGLYLFFNASVQGTVNTMRGLNVFSKNSSRTKQGIVGGIMAFGALTTSIAQSILGDDEYEKIPTYVRDRNIIIPAALWGGDPKEYVTIPLPYGYNVFHNLGENAYLVSSGNLSPEDAAVRSTNVFLGSFNPLGTSSSETYLGSVAKTATPQVVKPLLELVMNENYFGSPIYPPDSPFGGAQEPLSRRAFSNTPQIWQNITEVVSEFTGGNESEPGLLEVPPSAISYLLGFGLGGAGTFAERTFFKLPEAIADPAKDVELKDIPFVRRIYGEITEGANTEKYYERRQTLQQKDRQANDVLTGSERSSYRRENREYIRMLPVLKATEKRLRALRKAQKAIRAQMENATPSRAIELAEREQLIQKRIDDVMNRFNSRYSDIVGKAK